jgi:signal transduction histidine kinase
MRGAKGYFRPAIDWVAGILLLLLVGWLDYVTGYELSLLLFYLPPILYVQKRMGLAAGISMSLLAGAVWLAADIGAGHRYADNFTLIWEVAVRVAMFLLVAGLVSIRQELKILVEQRTAKLREETQERLWLEKELLQVAENEQRRIGHDLHDSLGQHLTATALAGKVLGRKLSAENNPAAAAAANLVAMTEEAIQLTRHLAHSLHPLELDASGLSAALQNLAVDVSKAFNVSCRFENAAAEVERDRPTESHIFRIAQEAVSNAVRHGHAQEIVIRLETVADWTELSITDDGGGLADDARQKTGLGLRIMDYRAKMISGSFAIQNQPGGGTRVVCRFAAGINHAAQK